MLFEKLDFEKDYFYYVSGGFIYYCEYLKLNYNLKVLEVVWDYVYDKVGYLGMNIFIDYCYCCGYDGDFEIIVNGYRCLYCGNIDFKMVDVVKRICGYLGNLV